ncbi:MAG: efflux RND transporter periplasmic adaptor subunit, partial [Microbacterium sp.]
NADGEEIPIWSEITAPADGTLSAFTPISGQMLSVADVVGAVAPSTFRVQGTIAPEDRYKLIDQPTEADIVITGGPTFTCSGLTIDTPLAGSDDADAGTVTTTIRCAVPTDVTVFPGLAATMTVAGGLAENVIVVPVTAVLGSAETGTVFVADDAGDAEPKQVSLGLNDGTNIEVTDGLAEGDEIFEYAPGDEQDTPSDDQTDAPREG